MKTIALNKIKFFSPHTFLSAFRNEDFFNEIQKHIVMKRGVSIVPAKRCAVKLSQDELPPKKKSRGSTEMATLLTNEVVKSSESIELSVADSTTESIDEDDDDSQSDDSDYVPMDEDTNDLQVQEISGSTLTEAMDQGDDSSNFESNQRKRPALDQVEVIATPPAKRTRLAIANAKGDGNQKQKVGEKKAKLGKTAKMRKAHKVASKE